MVMEVMRINNVIFNWRTGGEPMPEPEGKGEPATTQIPPLQGKLQQIEDKDP